MSTPTNYSYIPTQTQTPTPTPQSTVGVDDDKPTDGPPTPIDINVWGPATWNFMHVYSFEYPTRPSVEQRQRALAMLQTIHANLPCNTCRTHFGKILSEHEPRLESGDAFARWMVDAHNMVNRRLGKPGATYDSVYARYHAAGGTLCDEHIARSRRSTTYMAACVLVVSVVAVSLVFYNIGCERGHGRRRSTRK